MSKTLIKFGGHVFEPQSCGALYWRDENILIVSDLHFEKSSFFAKKGIFLPPYDSLETLGKLKAVSDRLNRPAILFLGDVFHDGDGLNRLSGQSQDLFSDILSHHNIIWVDGNHDRGNAPDNIESLDTIVINGILFTHIATSTDDYEISGHYHPCTSFSHKGHKVRRACYIYNDTKLIMPAYGSITGGLDCKETVVQKIIPNAKIQIVT
jgi:hypothetical protein